MIHTSETCCSCRHDGLLSCIPSEAYLLSSPTKQPFSFCGLMQLHRIAFVSARF